MCGMGKKIIRTNEYIIIKIVVIKTIQKKPTKILFFIEFHLVNELKTNLLIKTDIFKFQPANINYDNDIIIFDSYQNFMTTIELIFFNIKSTIKAKSIVIILPFTTIQIPVTYKKTLYQTIGIFYSNPNVNKNFTKTEIYLRTSLMQI